MRTLLGFALLFLLGGCAQSPSSVPAEAERGDVRRAQIHTELAAQYFMRGQHATALDSLRIALDSSANYAPAYNMLALVHTELRQYPQAEEHFRRAIAYGRDYSDAHNNYGYFLCQRGRHEEGLAQLEQALSNPLYTSPDKALVNAGVCALEKGDRVRAEGYLQRALRLAPNHAGALGAMAEVQFRDGHYLAVRDLLGRLSGLSELNAAALWLGVRAERKLGDRMAEASYGTQLRRRFPDAPQTRLLLSGQYDGGMQ